MRSPTFRFPESRSGLVRCRVVGCTELSYELIPLIAAIALGLQHVFVSEASPRSKGIVSTIVLVSLLIVWRFPRWSFAATLLQSAVSIYVLVQIKLDS